MTIASTLLPLSRILAGLSAERREAWAASLAQRSLRREGSRVQRARQHLKRCFPALSEAERAELLRQHFVHRYRLILNIPSLRYGPIEPLLQSIRRWDGVELLQALSARGRGVIVATPHFGDWERFNLAMGTQVSAAVLYKASRDARVDRWLLQLRSRTGVVPVAVGSQGIRELYRRLNHGGIVGILPDQVPRQGAGVAAPFFNQMTPTMSLIHRLVQSTGCAVVLGRCYFQAESVQSPLGEDQSGDQGKLGGDGMALNKATASVVSPYILKIHRAPEEIEDADPAVSAAALNRGIEQVIADAPAQYLWTYQRWSG